MKITIRFSILSILLILLLSTSLCIIGINFFTLKQILLQTTKTSINNAKDKISEQVSKYLQPLDQYSDIGAGLIAKNFVTPSPSPVFINFLRKLFSGHTQISAVCWADDTGNFYLLEKSGANLLINKNILAAEHKMIINTYDLDMNLLNSKENFSINFDPRLRPWYQQAKFSKKYSWLVYPITYLESQQNELVVTATTPVYDQNKTFLGVLGINISLGAISTFAKSISLTDNSIIFVCDEEGHLFSAQKAKKSLIQSYKMPTISNLDSAWVNLSFDIYSKKHESIFTFEHNHKTYIAAYEKIHDIKGAPNWNVGIVIPERDIIAPLLLNIIISFAMVLIIIIISIIVAVFFASHISKPIVKLAKDSELICQLRLEEVKKLYSKIKEIDYIANSFVKMKNALSSFRRYMPIALIKNLVLSDKIAEVGGEMKELTLFFSDIENFTSISEKMPPQQLMQYLSEYFQILTKIIINYHGTIDKYIGDGVMAFWGAPIDDPQHAFHACQATLQIHLALKKLNDEWNIAHKPMINTRISISTSQVVIGNVGSDEKLNYTALGDGVNLASRLEGLNKNYGTYTIVSEYTYNIVKNYFKFRLLDKVTVKGKTTSIYIYELLGGNTQLNNSELKQYNEVFQEAFNLYEQGKWEQAQTLFLQLAHTNEHDQLLKIFIERCKYLKKHPPNYWDGTWVIENK